MPFTSGPRRDAEAGRAVKRARIDPSIDHSTHDVRRAARCEMDSHADTICAGVNCRPLAYTGQVCDVSGFHNDLQALPNVPVATVATGYQTPDGEIFVLVMHEALYF